MASKAERKKRLFRELNARAGRRTQRRQLEGLGK
jgi:hypothetical protein